MGTPNTPSTTAELQAEIARLTKINSELKAAEAAEFRIQVSEKGAISVYGLGRFPVSLYKEQWSKVLSHASEILQFGEKHSAELEANQVKAKVAAQVEKQTKAKAK